jgi:hypothetical protein
MCHGIEKDTVLQVAIEHRPEAIAVLERSQFVALTGTEAARLTGVEAAELTLSQVVVSALARLTQERDRVLATRSGSWGGQEAQLVELERLAMKPDLASRRPYLVRAIVKNESTGGIGVSWCGDDLSVKNLFLGTKIPPSRRTAVVVFLEKVPVRVHVGWGMVR